MRYCVNVSILFTEQPFLERFALARCAGFDAVEFWWPDGDDLAQVQSAIEDAGLDVALINFDGGDLASGDRGLLSDPDTVERFRANVPVALEFGGQVGCRSFNALVGRSDPRSTNSEQLGLARESVRWAADQAGRAGANVLIEPINRLDVPDYLLGTTSAALAFIESIGRGNVRLQFDCYHVQRGEGNVVGALRDCFRAIGHMQIADSPDRHEPGTGELRFEFILGEAARLGYDGYVGLEYVPSGPSDRSFAWLAAGEA